MCTLFSLLFSIFSLLLSIVSNWVSRRFIQRFLTGSPWVKSNLQTILGWPFVNSEIHKNTHGNGVHLAFRHVWSLSLMTHHRNWLRTPGLFPHLLINMYVHFLSHPIFKTMLHVLWLQFIFSANFHYRTRITLGLYRFNFIISYALQWMIVSFDRWTDHNYLSS